MDDAPPAGGAAHPAGDTESVDGAEPILIANEFADVLVRRVLTRNGVRLEIRSPRTQTRVRLDALELESLTWQPPEVFSALLEKPERAH